VKILFNKIVTDFGKMTFLALKTFWLATVIEIQINIKVNYMLG